MLDVCAVCDDLVDVDHRHLPGFDRSKPVLCGGDKCLAFPNHGGSKLPRCWACEKLVAEVKEAPFGTLLIKRMACQSCISRQEVALRSDEISGHPV